MKKQLLLITIVLAFSFIFSLPETVMGEEKLPEIGMSPPDGVARSGYRIGSGDILEIITWKEPDFTREVIVRLDGKITFPLLDDLSAVGLRPTELKAVVEKKLKQFVEDPVVTVLVKVPTSQKFYILGEIAKTGEYPLDKELTVLQAFALAGGFTEWSSKKRIILLRYVDGQEKIYRINYKTIIKGKDFSQNIRIKANDTIIVP